METFENFFSWLGRQNWTNWKLFRIFGSVAKNLQGRNWSKIKILKLTFLCELDEMETLKNFYENFFQSFQFDQFVKKFCFQKFDFWPDFDHFLPLKFIELETFDFGGLEPRTSGIGDLVVSSAPLQLRCFDHVSYFIYSPLLSSPILSYLIPRIMNRHTPTKMRKVLPRKKL